MSGVCGIIGKIELKMKMKWIASGLALLTLAQIGWAQSKPTFKQEDLEKMVRELTPYFPEDPRLTYPVMCVVEQKNEANANASVYFDPAKPKNQKPQAKMTVYTGILKEIPEHRLIRAIVAHELAHLAKQHLGSYSNAQDIDLLTTRAQEYEADSIGAIALEKAGYSRKDMIDMLLRLGELERDVPGTYKVLGDHADCARRAAAVGKNDNVLRSLVNFNTGEAYLDARNYVPAMRQFDKAAADAPTFFEARYNSALAALRQYYDNLPDGVKYTWYLPDFGTSLRTPKNNGRPVVISDVDRAAYKVVLERVRMMLDLDAKRSQSLEIQGLTLVLDPEGTPANLQEGVKILNGALATSIVDIDRLRIANNLAIGYQRLGNLNQAVDTMMGEQKKSTKYNQSLAVNLGAQALPVKYRPEAKLAEAVLYSYLTRTSATSPGYSKARSTYFKICQENSLKAREIKPSDLELLRVMSINDGGREFRLFDKAVDIVTLLGKAQNGQQYNDKFPEMMELSWDGGNFTAMIEPTKIDDEIKHELIRITSYNKGAFITLKPVDQNNTNVSVIEVGMSLSDLKKILDPDGGEKRMFAKMGKLEEWTYFEALSLGLIIENQKVKALTVTPSNPPAK
jgi:tetratricopeptide (TPR) repeat protein